MRLTTGITSAFDLTSVVWPRAPYCMPVPKKAASPPRQLLRDDAFAAIRAAIVDGTLEPGERLVDAELSAWLGVSRTPIREALARLDAAGLVQTRPGRYTIVSPLDIRVMKDAQAVTAAMHELAVREAVAAMHDEHIVAMRTANQRFAAALGLDDVEEAIRADDEFHGVAVDLCANAAIRAVLDQYTPLLRRMERVRFASLSGRSSVVQHEKIADLAEQGDADAAAREARLNWLTLQ
ncbi:DNA-binding GntR family transcriptional regulator [Mycobacterium sp. URHB0021]|jgi:DNA-binding GntR family transcriptional regulator